MRHWVIVALVAIVAAGIGAAAALYFVYPNQVQLVGGETRSELLSLNAPPGTLTTESNAAFKGAAAPAAAAGPAPGAAAGDWPSYNKTLTTERFSALSQIDTRNVSKLKMLCTTTPVHIRASRPV
jgi:alcohol dehydrogenase (cytochrome c)